MIPIIYDKTETAFVSNGLGRLRDCLTCEVAEERNGIYECEFTYPVDGANYDLIIPGRVITVTHDDTGDVQPFDIVSFSRPIDGIVTFHCVHLSYRLRENLFSAQNINDLSSAVTALNSVLSLQGSSFRISADFTASGYASVFDATPRTVRQCLGGTEGSLLDAYGGEYKWDKWNVYLMKTRGTMRSLTIRYGVNMNEYEDEADFSATYNKCIPYWKSGDDTIAGNVVSTGQTLYSGRDVTVPLDLSDKFENKPTTAQLEAKALSIMNGDKTWLPEQNIKVNFIRLQDSPEYEEYAPLMTCSLCDTINMVFPRYNVAGSFKIVRIVWDVLQGRYIEMELGDLQTSLADALGVSSSGSGGKGIELVTETHEIIADGTQSISNYYNSTKALTKSGYMPLAVAGYNINGTYRKWMHLSTCTLTDIAEGSVTVNYFLSNTGSNAWAGALTVDILWMKI